MELRASKRVRKDVTPAVAGPVVLGSALPARATLKPWELRVSLKQDGQLVAEKDKRGVLAWLYGPEHRDQEIYLCTAAGWKLEDMSCPAGMAVEPALAADVACALGNASGGSDVGKEAWVHIRQDPETLVRECHETPPSDKAEPPQSILLGIRCLQDLGQHIEVRVSAGWHTDGSFPN